MKLNFLLNRQQIFTIFLSEPCSHLGALLAPISVWCLCIQCLPKLHLDDPHTQAAAGCQWSVCLRCSQWYLVPEHLCSQGHLSCWWLTAKLSIVATLPCLPLTPPTSVPLGFAHLPSYAPNTLEKFLRSRFSGACELRGQAWILLLKDGSSYPCVLNKVRKSLVNDSFTRVINGRGRFLQETKGTAVS